MKHGMKHRIQQCTMVCSAAFMLMTACAEKRSSFDFCTAQDALTACRKELSKIERMKSADIKTLGEITNEWLEIQDSTVSVMMRDTTAVSDNDYTVDLFAVTDSIRKEILRLALAEERSMPEIVRLKVATAHNRKKTVESKDFKAASGFYAKMDDEPLYKNLTETLDEYDKLLTSSPFKKEQQMLGFIRREDKCFRSLLTYLTEVPEEHLQDITDKTADLFDNLYRKVAADPDNELSERVMLFLTMRFNRRVIQNAEACMKDIKEEKKLNSQQTANYRWMIIQPFMTIDNHAMATLTEKQVESLVSVAGELPALMAFLDGKDIEKGTKEQTAELSRMLSEYFLKAYLKSIL